MKFIKIPGKDFEVQETPVTQKQWQEIMGNNPSNFKGEDSPVECVNFLEAEEFIKKLNDKKDGFSYKLPSDEDWHSYCGKDIASDNLKKYAWFWENSEGTTHPVKLKKPNEFGLYDIWGNVWEMTSLYLDSSRVIRGGSWDSVALVLRSGNRFNDTPNRRFNGVGFRLLRTASDPLQSSPFDSEEIAIALAKVQTSLDELKELVKEVSWNTLIKKQEFIFKREFMCMEHNYLCAICKDKSAVQETHTGILQPCWDCQKKYKIVKLNWLDRLMGRSG